MKQSVSRFFQHGAGPGGKKGSYVIATLVFISLFGQGLLSYLSPVVSLHTLNTTRRMCELECVAQLRFSHDITGARTTSKPVITPTYLHFGRLLKRCDNIVSSMS